MRNIALAFLAGVALTGGSSLVRTVGAQDTPEEDVFDMIQDLQVSMRTLEDEVKALKKRKPEPVAPKPVSIDVETGVQVRRNTETLDEVVVYLDSLARSAKQLEAALSESEEKGFTYGINPESRIVLLKGFRHVAGTLQKDVPGEERAEDVKR